MAKSEEELRAEIEAEYRANMQEELMAYRKSLQEEYGELGELDPDDPATADKVRGKLLTHVPAASTTIGYLIMHAESEAVRANLSKFVFQEAIGKAKTQDEEDNLRSLLKGLAKNDD